jgi:hypothetical protein
MITHNPEAAAVAGRILHMRDGRTVSEERGTPPGVVQSQIATPESPAV